MADKEKFGKIKELKDRFMGITEMALNAGVDKIDAKELGEVVDMIKDMAETEKYCAEAEYYCHMLKMMEENKDNPEMMMEMARMGYNPNRSVTGRYDTRGGDHTAANWRYGYPDGNSSGSSGIGNSGRQSGGSSGGSGGSSGGSGSSGYPYYPDGANTQPYMMGEQQHGRPYNEYKRYMRNYHESKNHADKEGADRYAMEHVQDTVETMRDIWKESDPELKRKMKTDLSKLLSEMN